MSVDVAYTYFGTILNHDTGAPGPAINPFVRVLERKLLRLLIDRIVEVLAH